MVNLSSCDCFTSQDSANTFTTTSASTALKVKKSH